MTVIAFWNVHKMRSPKLIVELSRKCDADILILAECLVPQQDLLHSLNHEEDRVYFPDPGNSERLTICSRIQDEDTDLILDEFDVAMRQYRPPGADKILVVSVHLNSKLWKKTEDQILASTRLANEIAKAEQQVGHSRTILIGDLNMNPFEAGVVGSEGLHAVMDRRIASSGSRKVSGRHRQFFYNPMWSYFGDLLGRAAGTYYYNSGTEVNYFWNIFDQVLVRPSLLAYMRHESVQVVTEINGKSLVNRRGRAVKTQASDHLPIILTLDLLGAF